MKNNLIEETNRMRNLFGYKAGKVISEQKNNYSKYLNEQDNDNHPSHDADNLNPQVNNSKPEIAIPNGVSQAAVDKILEFSKENKSGNRGSYLFPPQQSVIDSEFGAGTYNRFFYGGGEDVLKGNKIFKTVVDDGSNQKNVNTREQNLITIYKLVDKDGVIRAPGSQMNGVKWEDYVKTYNVTPEELSKLNVNTREQNLLAMYKLVDKDGIIRAPGSAQQNNKKWSDYVTEFKVTPEELSKLKGNDKVVAPKTVAQIQIPKELVDINGVKKFQEWLNTQDPTWVNGKPLVFDPKRGYGRFGPLTSASWNKLKDVYLKEIGSLQANQKVVAKPELASTAVAPAQAAKITT
jgi:hypothetical protein